MQLSLLKISLDSLGFFLYTVNQNNAIDGFFEVQAELLKSMKIETAEFYTSVADVKHLPRTGYPEIAFTGRSNVGKSSLINCLLNRKNIAKTSSTPGKTRLINYFEINSSAYFVDLPGYGFARIPPAERDKLREMIKSYFQTSQHLAGVVIIIDIRHELSPLDRNMIEWIARLGAPAMIVATKADKLSKTQSQKSIAGIMQTLALHGITDIIPFSSATHSGKQELWQAIGQQLKKDGR